MVHAAVAARNNKMEKHAKVALKMGRDELKVHLLLVRTFASAMLLSSAFLFLPTFAESPDALAIPRAEFAKYYTAVTGKPVPEGMVRFAIDPAVSKSGKDAYRIESTDKMSVVPVGASTTGKTGVSPVCVTITGSNMRSVMYGVYDLLERRAGCRWFWDGDIVPKKGA